MKELVQEYKAGVVAGWAVRVAEQRVPVLVGDALGRLLSDCEAQGMVRAGRREAAVGMICGIREGRRGAALDIARHLRHRVQGVLVGVAVRAWQVATLRAQRAEGIASVREAALRQARRCIWGIGHGELASRIQVWAAAASAASVAEHVAHLKRRLQQYWEGVIALRVMVGIATSMMRGKMAAAVQMMKAGVVEERWLQGVVAVRADREEWQRRAAMHQVRAAMMRLAKGEVALRVEVWRTRMTAHVIAEGAGLRVSLDRAMKAGRMRGEQARRMEASKARVMQLLGSVAVRDMRAMMVRLTQGEVATRVHVWRQNMMRQVHRNRALRLVRRAMEGHTHAHAVRAIGAWQLGLELGLVERRLKDDQESQLATHHVLEGEIGVHRKAQEALEAQVGTLETQVGMLEAQVEQAKAELENSVLRYKGELEDVIGTHLLGLQEAAVTKAELQGALHSKLEEQPLTTVPPTIPLTLPPTTPLSPCLSRPTYCSYIHTWRVFECQLYFCLIV